MEPSARAAQSTGVSIETHAALAWLASIALLVALCVAPWTEGARRRPRPARKPKGPAAIETLVAAERAFARACGERGVRASFLEFFAPDGLSFDPEPGNARARLLAQPAPAQRPPFTLDWQPLTADVSAAGDFGWTTGPFELRDQRGQQATRHGFYFSVWKRQADGAWKVLADLGTGTPTAGPIDVAAAAAHYVAWPQPEGPAAGWKAPDHVRAALQAIERDFDRACGRAVFADCLARRLAPQARLHRDGQAPIVGRAAIQAAWASTGARPVWQPQGGEAARSGDLAFTYGSYALARPADSSADVATGERGHYLHVWRRNAQGFWLAAQVVRPTPPQAAAAPPAASTAP
jgi:ketosteroid isomerase-like protein